MLRSTSQVAGWVGWQAPAAAAADGVVVVAAAFLVIVDITIMYVRKKWHDFLCCCYKLINS